MPQNALSCIKRRITKVFRCHYLHPPPTVGTDFHAGGTIWLDSCSSTAPWKMSDRKLWKSVAQKKSGTSALMYLTTNVLVAMLKGLNRGGCRDHIVFDEYYKDHKDHKLSLCHHIFYCLNSVLFTSVETSDCLRNTAPFRHWSFQTETLLDSWDVWCENDCTCM